jgi:predicted DNA-binding transcriptional regulator AlpA
MTKMTPILASETTAAHLLDMKPAEFRELVKAGSLPKGREIAPGVVRWSSDDLRRIANGDAIDGGIEW